MTIRYLVASFHLIALAIGFGAVVCRAQALKGIKAESNFKSVMVADALWGVAALLWLGTGLWRAFGGLEKGTTYYLQHPLFHAKMGLFVTLVVIEFIPALGITKWRSQLRRSETVDVTKAPLYVRISMIEAAIVLAIVFLAAGLARGVGI